MKKLILLFSLFLAIEVKPLSLDSLALAKIDTTIIAQHPTSEDSATVVKIVNGVITFSTIFIKQPLVSTLVKNPAVSGGIVAFILGIWRSIEKRRLRRKGLLVDKALKSSSNGLKKI